MGVLDQAAPAAAPNSLFNDSKFIGEADASNQLTQQEYSQTRNLLLDSKLEKAITPPLYMVSTVLYELPKLVLDSVRRGLAQVDILASLKNDRTNGLSYLRPETISVSAQ